MWKLKFSIFVCLFVYLFVCTSRFANFARGKWSNHNSKNCSEIRAVTPFWIGCGIFNLKLLYFSHHSFTFFAKLLWQFKICTFNEKLAPRPFELTQVKQPYVKITVNFEINISEIKQGDCLCVGLLFRSKDWCEVSWHQFDHPTSSVWIYLSIVMFIWHSNQKERCDVMDFMQITRAWGWKILNLVKKKLSRNVQVVTL